MLHYDAASAQAQSAAYYIDRPKQKIYALRREASHWVPDAKRSDWSQIQLDSLR